MNNNDLNNKLDLHFTEIQHMIDMFLMEATELVEDYYLEPETELNFEDQQ